MADPSPLINSLRAAVAAAPDDVTLRLHLAELLLAADDRAAAVVEVAQALQREPGDPAALALMGRLAAPPAQRSAGAAGESAPTAAETGGAATGAATPAPQAVGAEPKPDGFDWRTAQDELKDVIPPRFHEPVTTDGDESAPPVLDVEESRVTLADVAGMAEAKKRLEAAFLAPIRNPKLRRFFGKSLRGGLLMYGPPGCGKTFLAKAVAGELGAAFIPVTLNEILERWLGDSERNLHALFEAARLQAPCVLFFDELDAIGGKRDQLRSSGMRNVVNQLLTEMDGVGSDNEGVYLLAATNHPWDVDVALRRPGRFDRTVLVSPPDTEAREQILRATLRDRPIAGIEVARLAKRTEGLSGADLTHLCELATEAALMDSIASGEPRMITQDDMETALGDVRPSADPWFATARNVAMFSNDGGMYDDLVTYLKRHRKWLPRPASPRRGSSSRPSAPTRPPNCSRHCSPRTPATPTPGTCWRWRAWTSGTTNRRCARWKPIWSCARNTPRVGGCGEPSSSCSAGCRRRRRACRGVSRSPRRTPAVTRNWPTYCAATPGRSPRPGRWPNTRSGSDRRSPPTT
ncbi:hypothetical protein GCM10023223_33900 [Stackebrandtia albiflava]|nr:ATP-binding protein [Stackebrandtia albiflava]